MVAATQEKSAHDIALTILDDLKSGHPTYSYGLASCGEYADDLALLIEARKNGKTALENLLNSIKTWPDSGLADLLREQEETEHHVQVAPAAIPELPEHAQLPEVCLPRLPGDPACNWFDAWDSSKLRQVSPWLARYIDYSYQCSPEGYIDFHPACGLFTLSSVAARRVVVDLSPPAYPLLTTALVARSSLFAKTTTARVAIAVLKAAGLDWLLGADETTPQKLLADMAGRLPSNYAEMDTERQEWTQLRVAMSGQRAWYYDEFNQLLEAMTRPGAYADFAGLLRKLDGCPDDYTYTTHAHGEARVEKPYLALLASTTPANLRKHATNGREFWHDGFWARFAFITPPPDAFRTQSARRGRIPVPAILSRALTEWNTRLGMPTCEIEEQTDDKGKGTGRYQITRGELPETSVTFSQDAYNAYDRYRRALRDLIAESKNEDLDSSYVRLADKALRVAALIASLEHNNCIDMAVWTLAQEITEMFRRNLHEFYAQVNAGEASDNPLEDAVIEFLKARQGNMATVREIRQFGSSELRKRKADGIRDILISLERSGVVQCKRHNRKEVWILCH